MTLSLTALVIAAPPAGAQPGEAAKWEVEIHGGRVWPTNPGGGTMSLPPPGEVFITDTRVTVPAPTSRRESSWYFGDGAVLFNQAVAALGMLPGRIAALDPVLGRPLATRKPGGSIGVSLSRALTPRLGAELSVDYSRVRLYIAKPNSDAIEATRASFVPAFEGMIRFNPNRVLNSVTSAAAFDDGNTYQLFAAGSLVVNLRDSGTLIPYASLGVGLIAIGGEMPRTTLNGNYQFRLPGGPPINESDSVTVRAAGGDRTLAGIVGGGVKYQVSRGWGIRLGVRIAVSGNAADTILDAAPNVALGLLPAGRGVLGGNPSIQFSNNSTDPVNALDVTAVSASSLTAPPIAGFRTFSGRGVVSHTNVTAGVFWRF
jgi:hypothetical protein